MNLITPIILIIISIGTFFMYVDPNYRGTNLSNGARSIQDLQKEDAEYQVSLDNTTAIRMKRQALVDKQNKINPNDLSRLQELLPDNVDNIKLVIDMNQIAENHNLVLKNIKLDTATQADPNKLGADTSKHGTVGLSFSVSSSYDNFQNFLTDLEKSLRLVEITDLSVTGNDTGIYDFSVGLKTYWLK
jgi:Tfp pilus assembly protein PilO